MSPSRPRRQGLSFIYVLLIFIPLIGFAAFAVDVGRIRLARAELQTAADASARAAAANLPYGDSTNLFSLAANQAVTAASRNDCLSDSVALDTSKDLIYGIWNPTNGAFSPTDAKTLLQSNAVEITTKRIASRSNPIQLYIAPILGFSKKDVETTAVAYVDGNPTTGYGFVGIESIVAHGNKAFTDSYTPPNYNDATKGEQGSIASNGDISLGNSDVYGDVRAGGDINSGPNTQITGWQGPLNTPLNYPDATVSGNATSLQVQKNKTLTLNGSLNPSNPTNYSYTGTFDPGDIKVTGYVALYINGDVKIDGNEIDQNAYPLQLRIYVVGSHNVDIGGTPIQRFELYAPLSDVTVHGNADFYGSIIGKSITVLGDAELHYDLSDAFGPLPPYKVTLVY